MSCLSFLLLIAGAGPMRAPDSVAVLKSAKRAQEAFEFARRHNLPERAGGWSGFCGERIGRVCYWYERSDEADEDKAPEEPSRIREARTRLLVALEDAAETIPGDEWIVGQRVRYLLEDRQPVLAARVAEQCRAVTWWCEALAGLVRHVRGDFVGADSVFAAALADMPDDERCRWSDISSLLEGELAARYRRLDCTTRAAFEARWWWLAQPLYSLGGNDRRTEHFARRVMVRIQQGRRSPLGLYWDDDLRDVILRYGWPTWWTREPPTPAMVPSEPVVTGHDPSPAFRFAPAARALENPASARPDDWRFESPGARERYAPAYAKAFTYLEHQRAVFRRGDSCIVVAAYDLSADTLFAEHAVTATLALGADERTLTTSRDSSEAAGPRALTATAPCQPLVFSLEALAQRERHVARARYGLAPAPPAGEQAAISDLLLFDPPDSLPTTLDAVVPYAHSSARVPSGHRLGVFWELYGIDPASGVVDVSLTIAPQGTGWLRRAVESVGLATRRSGVRLEWQEVPQAASLAPRALALDLAGLSPGRYVIEVAVASASREALTAQREIRIERP
jgi:hypothetical protein